MSKYCINELYGREEENLHLASLLTDLGEKSLYDAVSQCNRCGYCQTSCPTYLMTGRETLSSRGRNQLLRMLIEGRTDVRDGTAESLNSCMLCGACSSACYAGVPTADIALEGRRTLSGYGRNFFAGIAVRLLLEKPELFALCLKTGFFLKRLGLARLAGAAGLYHFLGIPSVREMQRAAIRTPFRFLRELLKKDKSLHIHPGAEPRKIEWAYFAPCGPDYIFPEVGLATINLLKRFVGDGVFINNACCGLLPYNYGRLDDARKFAMKNIAGYEALKEKHGDFIVVGDCSSCVAFMKTYEQLFAGDGQWRARARDFSLAVKDILEVIGEEKIRPAGPEKLEKPEFSKITYHDSCRACHGQGIRNRPRDIIKKLAGARYRELAESDRCCGGAGAFAFTHKKISDAVLDRKIRNIAAVQAGTVIAGATSCLIQLNGGLAEKYPSAKVTHFSVFIDSLTK